MPRPQQRTRTKKRISKPSLSGKNKVRYKEKITSPAHCRLCGQPLAGTHPSTLKTSKLNRSKKRMWRPYGGQLCHNCLKISLRQAARKT